MYRQPAPRDPNEAPPRELAWEGAERGLARMPAFDSLLLLVAPVFAAFFLNALGAPILGSVAGAVVAFGVAYKHKRRKRWVPMRLRVEAGDLRVVTSDADGEATETLQVRLGEILDVTLDTKTEGSVQYDPSPIPALRFANARPGPSVDKARVMLVVEDRGAVAITPTRVAYMDATDAMGKVRVFLRGHGWVPEDEREGSAD